MPKRRQLRGFDLKQIEGIESLIGVDEVGRGALAGPVVAGAVLVNRAFLERETGQVNHGGRVNDSKQLSAADRGSLWTEFWRKLMAAGQIHAFFRQRQCRRKSNTSIFLGRPSWRMRRALEGIYPPTAFQLRTEPPTSLFSSMEERTAFQPPYLLPHPDRWPAR